MSEFVRILLIDDNPDDRLLTIRELKKEFADITVFQITDKESFEKALEKGEFDICITDYQLRWSDGIEILKEIKRRFPLKPVIMFTATGSEEIAVEAMKLGLDDYVLKSPKHFKRLPFAIKSVLEKTAQRRKLLEKEKEYEELFNRIPIGIYRTFLDGKILEMNPAAKNIFGYTEEDVEKGINVSEFYVDPEDRKKLINILLKEGIVKDYEVKVKRKDGKIIWVELESRLIRDENGYIKYIEGAIHDITERKILETQLLQAQKMEAIGRLAGNIAHDINNMLTPIRGFAELILMKLPADSPLRRYAEEILNASDLAASLIKRLLIFSRRQMLEEEVIDMNLLIEDMSKMLERVLGEDIKLVLDLNEDIYPIKGDRAQIEQVIMNLAVNARDAMPKGGRLLIKTEKKEIDEDYVRLHPGTRPGKYVLLTIEDTGIGMDEEIKKHIFEPFFTTKEKGKGTGLGLAIVYGIVNQHNGWINVYSEKGMGTTFRIYFPAYGEKSTIPKKKRELPYKELKGNGEVILIVEDEENVRKFAETILSTYNYKPLVSSNLKEARKIFEKKKKDIEIVLVDVVLPDGRGTEFVKEILKKKKNLKIIMFSGYVDKEEELSEIKRLNFTFIQKPFTSKELLEKLKSL